MTTISSADHRRGSVTALGRHREATTATSSRDVRVVSLLSRVDFSGERPWFGQWLAAAWRTRLAVRGDKLPWLLLGAARRTRIARWSNATNTSRTPRPRNACPVLLPQNTPNHQPDYPTTHLPATWSSSSTAGAHTTVEYIHTYIIHPRVVTTPYEPPPHTFSDTHTGLSIVGQCVTSSPPSFHDIRTQMTMMTEA